MSFGRRLGLFLLLLVIVPVVAMVAMLLFVSEESRHGKADARLAAGVETAIATYGERVTDGIAAARRLGTSRRLAGPLVEPGAPGLEQVIAGEVESGRVESVQVLDEQREVLGAEGDPEAIAYGEIRVMLPRGTTASVRASTATAADYATEVKRLTGREVVVSQMGEVLAATIPLPELMPGPGETVDVEVEGREYRARQQPLGSGVAVLLLGPRTEGALLTIGAPAGALLVGLLLLALISAWVLARALSALHQRAEALAVTDPLTSLWNRRRMHELLGAEFERQRRFGRELSLLIVDVDDFKSINDRFGHPQGDLVLQRVAEVLQRGTRAIDAAIRYGGDEMALILSETGAKGARVVAERLRKSVAETEMPLDGGKLGVTVSVGAATAPRAADDVDELIRAADDALLRAKRSGKNRARSAPKRRAGRG